MKNYLIFTVNIIHLKSTIQEIFERFQPIHSLEHERFEKYRNDRSPDDLIYANASKEPTGQHVG